MAQCSTCGNNYDRSLEVILDGQSHVFDCFECAIHKLAPTCEVCGCRIIGHGVQYDRQFFCSVHCARQSGIEGLADNVTSGIAHQPPI